MVKILQGKMRGHFLFVFDVDSLLNDSFLFGHHKTRADTVIACCNRVNCLNVFAPFRYHAMSMLCFIIFTFSPRSTMSMRMSFPQIPRFHFSLRWFPKSSMLFFGSNLLSTGAKIGRKEVNTRSRSERELKEGYFEVVERKVN